MKKLLVLLMMLPVIAYGQTEERYLAGAVPVEEGKVVFSKKIEVKQLTPKEIYETLLDWANKRFNGDGNLVVFSDKETGDIAAVGREYIVFQSTALSLDRTLISYNFTMECDDNTSLMKMSNIRYQYDVSYQRQPERYVAEEWITDEYALNKNKTKLNRISGKFRTKTIDYADALFEEVITAIGNRILGETKPAKEEPARSGTAIVTVDVKPEPASVVEIVENVGIASEIKEEKGTNAVREGYVSMKPDQIPATLVAMFSDSHLAVYPEGNKESLDKAVEWKGIGTMFGKNIATISLKNNSPVLTRITDGSTYVLHFLKEESDELPWMILECGKQGETKEGDTTTVIGEILQVWIK